MNTYRKYCPNVYVAQCEEKYSKGDLIEVQTRYGKVNEHIVHNLVGQRDGLFFFSITRADGLNNQERAKKKVDQLNSQAQSAESRSDEWIEKSKEGKDFLALGEPIKVGHHSEKRHRALIERNWRRMDNAMSELDKAKEYRSRISYWEDMSTKVDLSMPESVEFFEIQLEEAIEYHKGLKDGTIAREHTFSLQYANKRVKDLKVKCELAKKLWA